jgi:NhaP-type Na+/H+ or K+/H+ antiporter
MDTFSPSVFAAAVALVGVVIVAAAAISGSVERFRIPSVALFLALGAAIGPFGLGLADFALTAPTLGAVATLSLVLVLFTDAVTIDLAELKRHARLAILMLGPATLVTTVLIAAAGYWILGLSVAAAAIVGAALSSTDPVMMRALLRSPHMPQTARYALGVESGLNDVVLLPVIVIAASVLAQGAGDGHQQATAILNVLLTGPLAGIVVAFFAVRLLEYVRRRHGMRRDYESLYVLGVAFTAYAFAETIHGSGFMAAFTAGVTVAAIDIELCDCFHEYGEATAEMLLLFAFVAFGTSLMWRGLDLLDWRIAAFGAIALIARTAVLALALLPVQMGPDSRRLIVWYGPRALSSLLLVMVAVFAGVPQSERLFAITSIVVVASIVFHGGMFMFVAPRGPIPAPAPAQQPDRQAVRSSVSTAVSSAAPAAAPADTAAEPEVRITLDEIRAREARGERVVVVDARADGAWRAAATKARGAVRVDPAAAVQSAAQLALPRHDWLVAYCA